MAISPIIFVRSKDAQKQLVWTLLRVLNGPF